jgi:hypothetical protein
MAAWWSAPTDILALDQRRVLRVRFTWPDDTTLIVSPSPHPPPSPTNFTYVTITGGDVTDEPTTTALVTLANYWT